MERLAEEKTPVTVGNSSVSLWSLTIPFANTRHMVRMSAAGFPKAAAVKAWACRMSDQPLHPVSVNRGGLGYHRMVAGGGVGGRRPMLSPSCSSCPFLLLLLISSLPLFWVLVGTRS